MDKRFFLDVDQDGRWFVVPSDKRQAWIDWQQDDLADPDEPPDGCRRIYGSPSKVTFTDPDGCMGYTSIRIEDVIRDGR